MKFKSLELRNFRNFKELQLDLSPSVNVFLGDNGQGKTNLLESIHFITRGSSFRPGQMENFIRHDSLVGTDPSFIRANLDKNELTSRVEMVLEKKKKSFFVDKKRLSSAALNKKFPSVLFSPESLSSIKDGPDQRRSLTDEFLVLHHPENATLLQQFRKALRSRNQLFKAHLKGDLEFAELEKTLASLNPSYLKAACILTRARIKGLTALLPKISQAMKFISGENVDISVEYLISEENSIKWSDQEIYDALRKRMIELQRAEMASGLSLVGPHKHDIRFLFNEKDSRYYCSQGQQRALILSYKMAQIVYYYEVYQSYPILLLDDVMSELDSAKRTRLVEFLQGIEAQIFITTTDFDLSRELETDQVSVFNIKEGEITESI